MDKDFSYLVVGDEVYVGTWGWSTRIIEMGKVTKITPSGRIYIDGDRMFNKNGSEYGHKGGNRACLLEHSSETREAYVKQEIKSNLESAVYDIQEKWMRLKNKDMSLTDLHVINNTLKCCLEEMEKVYGISTEPSRAANPGQ